MIKHHRFSLRSHTPFQKYLMISLQPILQPDNTCYSYSLHHNTTISQTVLHYASWLHRSFSPGHHVNVRGQKSTPIVYSIISKRIFYSLPNLNSPIKSKEVIQFACFLALHSTKQIHFQQTGKHQHKINKKIKQAPNVSSLCAAALLLWDLL